MTRSTDMKKLREQLQRRRKTLIEIGLGHARELKALKNGEKGQEFEESAQSELADFTLSTLLENQRHELMLIDAAITRMDQGSYGECIDCGVDISYERLEALPFAIRCEEDAGIHERRVRGSHYAPPTL